MRNYRMCPHCGEMICGWEEWMKHKADCKKGEKQK